MAPNPTPRRPPSPKQVAKKAEKKIDTARQLAEAVRLAKVACRGAVPVFFVAVDPGPSRSAYACIEASYDGGLRYVDGEHGSSVRMWQDAIPIECALTPPGAVVGAVERPEWMPKMIYAKHLVETARVAGTFEEVFREELGRPAISLRALDWKRIIGLKPNANDAEVKAALPRLVSGIPKTNCHVRDAIGVAVAAAKLMGLGYRMVKP